MQRYILDLTCKFFLGVLLKNFLIVRIYTFKTFCALFSHFSYCLDALDGMDADTHFFLQKMLCKCWKDISIFIPREI